MDVLARLGSLRLPSVARLEFIPMKIGAGMTDKIILGLLSLCLRPGDGDSFFANTGNFEKKP